METKNVIAVHKMCNVPGYVPLHSQLDYGEIALNIADAKLFLKRLDGNVVSIGESISSNITPVDVDELIAYAKKSELSEFVSKSELTLVKNNLESLIESINMQYFNLDTYAVADHTHYPTDIFTSPGQTLRDSMSFNSSRVDSLLFDTNQLKDDMINHTHPEYNSTGININAMVVGTAILAGTGGHNVTLDLNNPDGWTKDNTRGDVTKSGTFDPDGGPISIVVSFAFSGPVVSGSFGNALDALACYVEDHAVNGDRTVITVTSWSSPQTASSSPGAYFNIQAIQFTK